jgi:hypothetical protein
MGFIKIYLFIEKSLVIKFHREARSSNIDCGNTIFYNIILFK